jgi:hypothetical protein
MDNHKLPKTPRQCGMGWSRELCSLRHADLENYAVWLL